MGLTRPDPVTGEVLPYLATDWDVSEDGTVYTFNMRDDIPWVNYDPATGEWAQEVDEEGNPRFVTAQDVVYGVKRTIDPDTASDYAYVLYNIVNAQEVNAAEEGVTLDDVGVEALDDLTVQFTLTSPAAYFPSIAGMWVANAQPQWAIDEWDIKWTEAGLIVTNGPMGLEEWIHGGNLNLVKNPLWPDKDLVQIERLEGVMITEASTAFAMYENNELDSAGVPLDLIDTVKADPVLSEEFVNAPTNCTYYYGFITENDQVNDVGVRKALSMGIDRLTLVETVTKGGQIPANTFTNPLNFGHAAEDPDIAPWALTEEKGGTGYAAAVEQGKVLLEEAGYPNGAGLDILLMHNVSEGHARIAQAIQAMWQEAYPEANFSIETQEWGVYLDTIRATTAIEQVPHVFVPYVEERQPQRRLRTSRRRGAPRRALRRPGARCCVVRRRRGRRPAARRHRRGRGPSGTSPSSSPP